MQVVLLAGGLGTRLSEETNSQADGQNWARPNNSTYYEILRFVRA